MFMLFQFTYRIFFLNHRQRGLTAIITAMLITGISLLIALTLGILILNNQKVTRNLLKSSQAYFLAEAGIEDSLYRIIKMKQYTPTNTLTTDKGFAEINISREGSSKIITSKGVVSQAVRKIKVELGTSATNISFHYGAQVDVGGIRMQQNSAINGNVYSNGSIVGSGLNSIITDDAWVAGGTETTPDQQWSEQNSNFPFGLQSNGVDYLDTAQSFRPSSSKILNKVSFYLKKVGNPPDQTIRIVTDNGGKPSRTEIAYGTLISDKVTETFSWIDVSLATPPQLVAGQTYWLLIDVAQDNKNYWVWGEDTSDNYAGGTGKYTKDWTKNSAVWTNVGGDLNFKIWLAGIATEIKSTRVGADAHANRIIDSSIGRDAYYQYIENTTVGRSSVPGSPDPPPQDLPISSAQIKEWEEAAESGGTIVPPGGNYYPANGSNLGPVKIEGNLIFPSNGKVTITGPVWVEGNIIAENNVTIELEQTLINGYTIIADKPSDQLNSGKINLHNNVITNDSSQGGKLLFISTNKSMDVTSPAIDLYNNVNLVKPQSIIFSSQGIIKVTNNAKFVEITGYALYLANNAEVVYDTGLVHAGFSTGPGGGWQVKSWQEIE